MKFIVTLRSLKFKEPDIAEFAKMAEKKLRNFTIIAEIIPVPISPNVPISPKMPNIAEYSRDFYYKLLYGRHE
jgi:hypothetical protein